MADIKVNLFSPVYLQEVTKLILDIQRGEFGVPITLDLLPALHNIA